MRQVVLLAALIGSLLVPAVALGDSATISGATRPGSPELLAFRGGFHLGGRGFSRRGFGSGAFGRRSSSRGLLHRVARALAFAYLLHLFFSHGGLSILVWLLVIGLLVSLVRRRRARNRYSY